MLARLVKRLGLMSNSSSASDSVDAAVSSLADRLRHPDALRIRSAPCNLTPALGYLYVHNNFGVKTLMLSVLPTSPNW